MRHASFQFRIELFWVMTMRRSALQMDKKIQSWPLTPIWNKLGSALQFGTTVLLEKQVIRDKTSKACPIRPRATATFL
jgi:hypothetical protein